MTEMNVFSLITACIVTLAITTLNANGVDLLSMALDFQLQINAVDSNSFI